MLARRTLRVRVAEDCVVRGHYPVSRSSAGAAREQVGTESREEPRDAKASPHMGVVAAACRDIASIYRVARVVLYVEYPNLRNH